MINRAWAPASHVSELYIAVRTDTAPTDGRRQLAVTSPGNGSVPLICWRLRQPAVLSAFEWVGWGHNGGVEMVICMHGERGVSDIYNFIFCEWCARGVSECCGLFAIAIRWEMKEGKLADVRTPLNSI